VNGHIPIGWSIEVWIEVLILVQGALADRSLAKGFNFDLFRNAIEQDANLIVGSFNREAVKIDVLTACHGENSGQAAPCLGVAFDRRVLAGGVAGIHGGGSKARLRSAAVNRDIAQAIQDNIFVVAAGQNADLPARCGQRVDGLLNGGIFAEAVDSVADSAGAAAAILFAGWTPGIATVRVAGRRAESDKID
jgi:hypothetical protein